MSKVTPRQNEVLNFIQHHLKSRPYAPSYREIQEHFGYQSVGTVYNLIRSLRKKGLLSAGDGSHRTFEVTSEKKIENRESEIKLIGSIIGGEPIQFYSQPQTIPVPSAMAPHPEKTYLLKAKGLQNEAINDGDLLVVEGRQDPQDGETILVLFKEKGAWIKQFSLNEKGIQLSSQGQQDPQIFSPDQLRIVGIVLGLLRIY